MIIMANFTPICQRYTDMMAHKYYLQHLLFMELRNNAMAALIMNITSVIIKLQVMANSLQNVQVCMCVLIHTNTHYNILQMENDGGTCIMFTPSQYRSMYYSRL